MPKLYRVCRIHPREDADEPVTYLRGAQGIRGLQHPDGGLWWTIDGNRAALFSDHEAAAAILSLPDTLRHPDDSIWVEPSGVLRLDALTTRPIRLRDRRKR